MKTNNLTKEERRLLSKGDATMKARFAEQVKAKAARRLARKEEQARLDAEAERLAAIETDKNNRLIAFVSSQYKGDRKVTVSFAKAWVILNKLDKEFGKYKTVDTSIPAIGTGCKYKR